MSEVKVVLLVVFLSVVISSVAPPVLQYLSLKDHFARVQEEKEFNEALVAESNALTQ